MTADLEEAIDRVITFGVQSNYDPAVMRRVVEELARLREERSADVTELAKNAKGENRGGEARVNGRGDFPDQHSGGSNG